MAARELFALTIQAMRERIPGCKVEVLVPDFQGSHAAMKMVMDARPDVLNHNTETVPRLYRQVRLGARYERSLEMLQYAKELSPATPTKSGLMLGLGETRDEVLQVMRDLAAHRVDILTLGQYLRPSPKHLPIVRYVPPEEFAEYRAVGQGVGICACGGRSAGAEFVSCGPFRRCGARVPAVIGDLMQVSKWGEDLAIRIPATIAEAMNLKEGDEVEIRVIRKEEPDVDRERKVKEALESIDRLSRPFPPDFKFNRMDAYER